MPALCWLSKHALSVQPANVNLPSRAMAMDACSWGHRVNVRIWPPRGSCRPLVHSWLLLLTGTPLPVAGPRLGSGDRAFRSQSTLQEH